jgi:hypothetical protein
VPITLIQPLSIGNALRLFITPKTGAKKWRVLRNTTGIFTGYDDATASVIHEGTDLIVLDTQALTNGAVYHYAIFWFNGTVWAADNINFATPNPTLSNLGTDVLSLVRDRLDEGLAIYISRGELHHKQNHIQVLTAPPLFEDTRWPVVTVHLQSDTSAERGIGDFIGTDSIGSNGLFVEHKGWLSRIQLLVVIWCLNPDERNLIRHAVKNLLIANIPVFDDSGVINMDVTQTDTEDFQSFGAPVYQTMTTISCLAPSVIGGTDYLVNVSGAVLPQAIV